MSEVTNKEELEKIDLFQLIGRFEKYLRRYWLVAVLLAALFGGIFFIREERAFEPMYQSRAMFSVSSGYSADDIFSSSYYDNAAAQQLASAFPYMISTQVMRDLMMEQLGTNYINGIITPAAVADSNMFTLTVLSNSPKDAQDILNATIDAFPLVAVYIVDNPQLIIREEASYSEVPINSFSWKGPVAKGAALGLFLALGGIALLAFFSKTVTSTDQLKHTVNLPVLAVIPDIRIKRRRSEKNHFIMTSTNPELTETMRSLALKARKLLENESKRVILVTSTLSGEGKTTISCNLATSLANEGHRVVLVDADIRSQSVAERFGLDEEYASLLDCLHDSECNVLECLQYVPGTNLAILSGESMTERRYNIDGKAMRRILYNLSQHFDYVVMDTAPCGWREATT